MASKMEHEQYQDFEQRSVFSCPCFKTKNAVLQVQSCKAVHGEKSSLVGGNGGEPPEEHEAVLRQK